MWLILVFCCVRGQPSDDPMSEAPSPLEPAGREERSLTPGELYGECRDRVELPEAAGECASDADCARTGCGQEVCTTAAAAPEVVTTCEKRRCFDVLDTCGCHEGLCSWTVKAELPTPGTRIELPEDVPR